MKALFCLYSAPLIESTLAGSAPLASNLHRGRQGNGGMGTGGQTSQEMPSKHLPVLHPPVDTGMHWDWRAWGRKGAERDAGKKGMNVRLAIRMNFSERAVMHCTAAQGPLFCLAELPKELPQVLLAVCAGRGSGARLMDACFLLSSAVV